MDRERLSPSKIGTLRACPYLFKITRELKLTVLRELDPAMTLGSFYHAATEAYDRGQDWEHYVNSIYIPHLTASSEFKATDYNYELIKQFQTAELPLLMRSYIAYQQIFWKDWEIIDVERQLEVPLGDITLVVIPDKVVRHRGTGKLAAVERKVTSRDDSGWERKFLLNLQTTAEVVGIERHYNAECDTVFIEQVVITRKKSKNWGSRMPQPLSTVKHYGPRPIGKSLFIVESFEASVRDTIKELRWRRETDTWPRTTSSCFIGYKPCMLYDICSGIAQPADVLVPDLGARLREVNVV